MYIKINKYTFVFFLFIAVSISAQNNSKRDLIFKKVVQAINENSYKHFEPYLSSEFTIAGQKGYIATMILEQLFPQMNETVLSYEKLNEKIHNSIIEVDYSINYKNVRERIAKIKFNKENEILELLLSETMQVKTMAGDSEIETELKDEIVIPFKQFGKLIVVDVLLNGEKQPFIIDSGSPRVVLNSAYIKNSDDGIKRTKLSNVGDVNGNTSNMDITSVKQLKWAEMSMNDEDVLSVNLSHLEEELEMEIYGLIGYELLKNYDLLIDYKEKKITLIRPQFLSTYISNNFNNSKQEKVPFVLKGHIPIINAVISNQSFKLAVDTGAEVNLISMDSYETLKDNIYNQQNESLIGLDNSNTKNVTLATLKYLEVGNIKFNDLETVFNDISHFNSGYSVKVDGIVGYELLSKHKSIIRYNNKEIIFLLDDKS